MSEYTDLTTIPLTVIQKCVNELLKRIEAMENHDNDERLWNVVTQGPVSGLDNTQYPAVGVDTGSEETANLLYPLVTKNIPVFIEFRFKPSINPYDQYRYLVGRLQHELLGDDDRLTLGGLCNNIFETGNNPEIEGPHDPGPGGVLILMLQYEHINGNPYKSRSDLDGNY